MTTLTQTFFTTQQTLLPALERELEQPLSKGLELLVMVAELIDAGPWLASLQWHGRGRPAHWRLPLVLSFIAKATLNLPTTRALLDRLSHDATLRRLCGWERGSAVPSEATFSRAFGDFARLQLPQRIHAAMLRTHYGNKLAGHISRDSTPAPARERATRKPPRPKFGRGRPRKGEVRARPYADRLQRQPTRSLAENLADLPTGCDCGAKKNSKGHLEFWRGYRLHMDVIDGEIPLSAILTSASTHDSQVAIALAQMSAQRVRNCYDLMDSAYDAQTIRAFSQSLGHVALIDPAQRQGGGALWIRRNRCVIANAR